jgi:phosphoribosylamine--glycine ligase
MLTSRDIGGSAPAEGAVSDVAAVLHAVESDLLDDFVRAVGVVLAAAGYPEIPAKGDVIDGIPADTTESVTFHAGTADADGKLVTTGGRVLCVVGLGDSVKLAQKVAYEAVEKIRFDGMQYRRDIGWRGLKH